MQKTIICYCVGGLGNRIRPLSSCYSLSLLTDRKLIIIWPYTTRCQANFDNLYDCGLDVYPDTFLSDIAGNSKVYGIPDAIYNERALFGKTELPNLVDKIGATSTDYSENIRTDSSDHIVIVTNNFLRGAFQEHENHFMKNILSPTKLIKQKIKEEQSILNLDKNTIGVHARATDFFDDHGVSDQFYYNLIRQNSPERSRIFVASDSKEMEESIQKEFIGTSREILVRENKHYVGRINQTTNRWADNLDTSNGSVVDAIVDMYLLAKTDFKVYHNSSTFAQIIQRLQ